MPQKNKKYSQGDITKIWSSVWENTGDVTLRSVFGNRLFIDAYERLRHHFPRHVKTATEIGTGTGRIGLSLAKDFPKTKFLLTDISDESLLVAERLQKKLGLANVAFSKNNVMDLSFSDNSLECVIMDCVIPHVEDPRVALQEVARVLRPGGYLLMTNVNTWNLPHTIVRTWSNILPGGYQYGQEISFTHNELTKLLERNGMDVIARDGFAVGYGIFRLKNTLGVFAIMGRFVNRLGKICDRFTGRWCSRNLGFQTLVLAQKNKTDF